MRKTDKKDKYVITNFDTNIQSTECVDQDINKRKPHRERHLFICTRTT